VRGPLFLPGLRHNPPPGTPPLIKSPPSHAPRPKLKRSWNGRGLAGGAIGDKGFIGADYIVTPVRKPQDRELYMSEHDYNNQISSLRAPVERAVANLKTWRILFTDYRRPLKTFTSSFRGKHSGS
jgi:hypothetical protein